MLQETNLVIYDINTIYNELLQLRSCPWEIENLKLIHLYVCFTCKILVLFHGGLFETKL